GGIGTPGARLQGPFVSGSAAALVSAVLAPVVTARGMPRPRPIKARRSSRPLAATGSSGGDALPSLRRLRMLMISSPLADGRHLLHRSIQTLKWQAAILLRCKAALNRAPEACSAVSLQKGSCSRTASRRSAPPMSCINGSFQIPGRADSMIVVFLDRQSARSDQETGEIMKKLFVASALVITAVAGAATAVQGEDAPPP